jgi:hypothetical protein
LQKDSWDIDYQSTLNMLNAAQTACPSHFLCDFSLCLVGIAEKLLTVFLSELQKDSWDIDYQATLNVLNAARKAGASHFVLLSAICVQKPLLEFQHAKLKFEAALQAAGDITYSIVRPTAFFKSLAGQVRPPVSALLLGWYVFCVNWVRSAMEVGWSVAKAWVTPHTGSNPRVCISVEMYGSLRWSIVLVDFKCQMASVMPRIVHVYSLGVYL